MSESQLPAARLLDTAASRYGDRTALVVPKEDGSVREVRYGELLERSCRVGSALRNAGLSAGDRVGALLQNHPEHLEVMFGAGMAGLVFVPINRRLGVSEVSAILDDADIRTLVTEPAYMELVSRVRRYRDLTVILVGGASGPGPLSYEELLRRGDAGFERPIVKPKDPQCILYTSGTTGRQKGVVRSHGANIAMARSATDNIPSGPGETWLLALPAHASGTYAFGVGAIIQGARLVMPPDFHPPRILQLIHSQRVNATLLVPTMWHMIVCLPDAQGVRLRHLRSAWWGGAPMPTGTLAELDRWLPEPCLGCYGLTEATCVTWSTFDVYRSGRRGSVGFPARSMEIAVVDDESQPVSAGNVGEVYVRGDIVMDRYFNRPDLTAEVLRPDGWLMTGDVGRLDDDGALTVLDRTKDVIISGGENIYPAELESSLLQMPGIVDVSVVGVPDDLWGQSVCAVIVASDAGVTDGRVVQWCRERHAPYKAPRRVVFVDDLPKNALGKVVKPQLLRSIT